MKWVGRMLALIRPVPPRPIESTKDELAAERRKRRDIARRTARLALILDDYRRQDGVMRR